MVQKVTAYRLCRPVFSPVFLHLRLQQVHSLSHFKSLAFICLSPFARVRLAMLAFSTLPCLVLALLSGAPNRCESASGLNLTIGDYTNGLMNYSFFGSSAKTFGDDWHYLGIQEAQDISSAAHEENPLTASFSSPSPPSVCTFSSGSSVLICASSSVISSSVSLSIDVQVFDIIEVCDIQDNSTTAFSIPSIPTSSGAVTPAFASQYAPGVVPGYTVQLTEQMKDVKRYAWRMINLARSRLERQIRELALIFGRLDRFEDPLIETYSPHDPLKSCGPSSLYESHPICLPSDFKKYIRLPLHDPFSGCALSSLFDPIPISLPEDRTLRYDPVQAITAPNGEVFFAIVVLACALVFVRRQIKVCEAACSVRDQTLSATLMREQQVLSLDVRPNEDLVCRLFTPLFIVPMYTQGTLVVRRILHLQLLARDSHWEGM